MRPPARSEMRTLIAAILLSAPVLLAAGFDSRGAEAANRAAGLDCDRHAAPGGSDSAQGTAGSPYATAQKLVDSLRPGQTGCLEGGSFARDEDVKISTKGITLASRPGDRAELRARLWVAADGVTVANLDLDGTNPGRQTSPTVTGSGATFVGNDVTNDHDGICFSIGDSNYPRTKRTLIEGNRIHDCGRLPRTNFDHGVYVLKAAKTVIRGNWIHDNADRGVQLYPDARRTRVVANVIDSNGEGVSFGGSGKRASSRNVVKRNVIANSKERWNVEAFWPDKVGKRNKVRGNCLWPSNSSEFYNQRGGVEVLGTVKTKNNVVAKPLYADRAAGDFALRGDDDCVAKATSTPTALAADG